MKKLTKKYREQRILNLAWTTKKEKEIIKNLGNNCIDVRNRTSHRTLLERYIKAAKELRVNWGDLDKREIIEFAEIQLANCPV